MTLNAHVDNKNYSLQYYGVCGAFLYNGFKDKEKISRRKEKELNASYLFSLHCVYIQVSCSPISVEFVEDFWRLAFAMLFILYKNLFVIETIKIQ